jgi:hypothetical protein
MPEAYSPQQSKDLLHVYYPTGHKQWKIYGYVHTPMQHSDADAEYTSIFELIKGLT